MSERDLGEDVSYEIAVHEDRGGDGGEMVGSPVKGTSGKTIREQRRDVLMKAVARRFALGEKPKDIAKALQLTPGTVQCMLSSERCENQVQRVLERLDREAVDIASEMQMLSPLALRRLEELLIGDDTPPAVVKTTADSILDRAGHTAKKRGDIVVHDPAAKQRVIAELVEKFREAMDERNSGGGDVVDGELVEGELESTGLEDIEGE